MFVLISLFAISMPAHLESALDVNQPLYCGVPYPNNSGQYPILEVTRSGFYVLDDALVDEDQLLSRLIGMSGVERLRLTIVPDQDASAGAFVKALGIARQSGVSHGVARHERGKPAELLMRNPDSLGRPASSTNCQT